MSEGPLLLRIDPERVGASGVKTVLERCLDPTHRSGSVDSQWDECQQRAKFLEDGTIKGLYGEKAAVGSAVHAAVAADLLGDPVGIRILVDRYLKEDGIEPYDISKVYEKAERLFTLWQEQVRPRWLQVGVYAVEWELHLTIAGVVYHVHPDCVLADGSVRDVKTSEQRLGENRADIDQQLTTYGYAIWRAFDHLPPSLGLDGLIYTNPPSDIHEMYPNAKKPWYDRQDSIRSVEQYEAYEASVARREASRVYADAIGVYQTQGQGGPDWVCKGCEAREICPAWRGTEWPKGAKRG